jgi:RNA polymerase sigma factor FliA
VQPNDAPLEVPTQAGRDSTALLWSSWQDDRSQAHRDALVAEYTELVRIVAAKTYRKRFSDELEYRDYVQFGMVGLLEAIDRFDTTQGVKFETFASHRIQGAILNGTESLSEKQRQIAVRRRVRAERAKSLVEGDSKADRLDPVERLADTAVGVALGLLLDNAGMYLDGEPSTGNTPYERTELAQLRGRLAGLVDRLPPSERRVVRGHYFQQIPFDQIAEMVGVTKGRISQVHHAALRRLRKLHEAGCGEL